MRSAAAVVAVVCFGLGALWFGTDGFRAITTEAARRLEVERAPRAIPPVVLEDQDGKSFRLGDYQGRLVLVDFFYTRCADLCPIVNDALASIRDALPPASTGRGVALLSISFDPQFDTPQSLRRYARMFDADGGRWRMARINDPGALRDLLETFGVIAIPDAMGGFEHNGAIHLIGRNGRLRRIYDYDAPEKLAAEIGVMR